MEEHNHKVGDKVKVIDRKHGHEFEIGEVVTIIDKYFYDEYDFDYVCYFNNKKWHLRQYEFQQINQK